MLLRRERIFLKKCGYFLNPQATRSFIEDVLGRGVRGERLPFGLYFFNTILFLEGGVFFVGGTMCI